MNQPSPSSLAIGRTFLTEAFTGSFERTSVRVRRNV
jgi:hypothetical protein